MSAEDGIAKLRMLRSAGCWSMVKAQHRIFFCETWKTDEAM
jgi:hypothetical protein